MKNKDELERLKIKVMDESKRLSKITKEHFNIKSSPRIMYNLKSLKTLGTFDPNTNIINLNEELLYEFGNLYIRDVFIHEFAHAVVFELYEKKRRVRPHGKEFKAICSIFGIDGKATTNLFKDSHFFKEEVKNTNRIPHMCGCKNKVSYLTPYRTKQAKEKFILCRSCGKNFKRIKNETIHI